MNKTYKYTLSAGEKKEITLDVGVNRLAISNANGIDGDVTIVTSEITKTASGDIVSFVDGADAPLADLKVNIEAVQSGSGDPSPTNVRPITGWTGTTINVSDEDTSNPTTYNIDWKDEAGTVGGGSVDIINGKIMVNKVGIKGVTVARIGISATGVRYADTSHIYADLVENTPTISDRYKQINTSATAINGQFRVYNGEFTIYDNRFTDLDTAQSLLNDVEFYYELATPTTYQLTPTEIRSLLGTNNVWADCGAITELKYFVQSTQPLFDYINDEDDRCVYIDCAQTGADTFSITSDITKAEFVSLLNNNKNVKLRLDTGSGDVIFDLSYIYTNYADFTYNRTAKNDLTNVNSFQSMTLRVDMSGDTLTLSRYAVITIGDGSYEYVAGQNNQLIKDGWSWSTQGYDLRDADELLFMITPMPNVASDSDTINGEMQRSPQDPKRALFCKGIKNMLPEVQEIESPIWFNDIIVVGNRATYTSKNDIVMKIRVWANYYSSPQHSLADVNFYANCDCNDSTANLWGMCNVFVFKKKR